MALLSLSSLIFAYAMLTNTAFAAISTTLVGTWSTKSAKVLTGPGFYNPVADSFIEPSHTGISYSFTADGFYEEAYYRAVSNAMKPECPASVLQFQHGTFTENADGSLTLTPFTEDGRQLYSDPCTASTSTYTRYNQTENFEKFSVYVDPYTKMTRLDLYQFDGSPMNPMFLAYSPPQMLPTSTMNPTPTAAATSSGKAKRTAGAYQEVLKPLNKDAWHIHHNGDSEVPYVDRISNSMVTYFGLGLCVIGGMILCL